jgi:hypothetical protein
MVYTCKGKLGIKKAIDTIKKIGSHEKRIANDIIHEYVQNVSGCMNTTIFFITFRFQRKVSSSDPIIKP